MSPEGSEILEHLEAVARERRRRGADPALASRVDAVKRYQHARFEGTYADLLSQPRYEAAARFFLEDLYGPRDFSERDEQFARIVAPLVRLFPKEIVRTVRSLAALHALSESLDTEMAVVLVGDTVDAGAYRAAWQAVGRSSDRARQIDLMLEVGQALDRYTRNPTLQHALRLMRAPARASGLGVLQAFLERGFDTFRAMGGAAGFLATVAERERELAARLFMGGDAERD